MSESRWPAAPAGFDRLHAADGALYVAAAAAAKARTLRLDGPAGWQALLASGDAATGRGASIVVDRWRLKQLRRGGLAAKVLGDRYVSPARLVGILAASGEAARRGVATPRAVALLVARASGFVRGFLATEEIEGAEDLARRALRGAASERALGAALAAARRMHDGGVDHPDLNLGNLLVVDAPEGVRGFVIDLDRVSFSDGPVPLARRRDALRRLERSCAKVTGCAGYLGEGSEDLWYERYAAGDAALARALSRGRPLRRFSIAVHRLGWPGGLR